MISSISTHWKLIRINPFKCSKSFISNSNDKDIRMPTPLSFGFDMKFHKLNNNEDQNPKKIVIISGWLGAKENQLKPYLQYYHKNGFDSISFAVGPRDVLLPSVQNNQITKALDFVKSENSNSMKYDRVVFHNFSVGGFLFGQMLRNLQTDNLLSDFTKDIVKAQVFDSPPDFNGIAAGVSKSMGIGGLGEKTIEFVLSTYLKAVENSYGKDHKAASHSFHTNFIQAPALWFYSKADPVARWEDCAEVIRKWRESGTSVRECIWESTPHIQHARLDPERYFGTLDEFLKHNNCLH